MISSEEDNVVTKKLASLADLGVCGSNTSFPFLESFEYLLYKVLGQQKCHLKSFRKNSN